MWFGDVDVQPVDVQTAEEWTRARARVRAHRLVRQIQNDHGRAAPEVAALTELADRSRWLDVAVVARMATVVGSFRVGLPLAPGLVERMVADAEAHDDPAVLAVALGARARTCFATRNPADAAAADRDLARAYVLLEGGAGGALERRLAHVQCATGFGSRRFWELELGSYRAALAIDPVAEEPDLACYGIDPAATDLAGSDLAIMNNVAETQASWAAALRAAGDGPAMKERCRAARGALDRACSAGLPASWLDDLAATRLLVDALEGEDVTPRAPAVLALLSPGSDAEGLVHLARALSLEGAHVEAAADAADAAVAILRSGEYPAEFDLAMHVAVEAEGAPAGIRLARHLSERLWADRQVARNAMEATIGAERFRTSNLILDRHAHIDELTGLANRRGYRRFRDHLLRSDSAEVTVMLVDLDRFKEINDRYGHGTGDRTLARVGAVLAAQVRAGDLAVRLGGDEFIVVFDRMPVEAATQRAEAVIAALHRTGRDGADPAVSVSIGLASGYPGDLDQLSIDADVALYRAKAVGGGRWETATPPA